IDEAGAGDVDLLHQIVGRKRVGDCLRELARLLARVLGEHHRGVGRHVAVGRIARRLDHDARLVDPGGQHPACGEPRVDGAHAIEDVVEDVVGGHRNPWKSLRRKLYLVAAPAAYRNSGVESKSRACSVSAKRSVIPAMKSAMWRARWPAS